MNVEVPEIRWEERAVLPKGKTAVLVVDMQNDFVDERGALFVPTAPATLAPIGELVERARSAGVPVIFTQDWHAPDDPEFSIWPRHAVRDTWGAEIVAALSPRPEEIRIHKTSYDPFFGTDLEERLRTRGVENLVIVGTVANICVLHAAGSAALRGFKVAIPADGVSALNEFDFNVLFRQLTFLYRGKAVKSCAKVEFE